MALEDKIDALITALEANTKALGSGGGSKGGSAGGAKATKQKHTLDEVIAAAQAVVKANDKAALKPFVDDMGFKVSDTPDDQLDAAMAKIKEIEDALDV